MTAQKNPLVERYRLKPLGVIDGQQLSWIEDDLWPAAIRNVAIAWANGA